MPEPEATPPIVIGKFIKGACTVDDRIFEKFMNYYYTIIINNSTKIHRKKMNRYGRRRSMRLINKKTNYTFNRKIKRSYSFDSDSSNIDVKDFVISFSNLKKIRKYNLHKPKIELGKVEKRDNAKCMDSTADDVGYTFQQYMDSNADDVGYTFQQYMDSTVEMSEETHTFEQRQCQNEFETSSIHSLEILQDEPITPQAQSTPAQVQNIFPAYIHWNSDFNVNSDYMSSINLGLGLFTAIFPNNRQASIYGRLSFRSYDDLNACQRYFPTLLNTQSENESIYLTTSGAQMIPNNRSSTSADQEENFDEMESESQQLSNNHSLPSAVPEKNFPDYDEMETQQSIESPREENEERYPTINRTQLQSQKFVPTITILSSSDEEDDEEMYEFSDISEPEADSLMDGNEEIQSEQPQRNPTPKLQIVRFEIDISSGEDYCRRTEPEAEVSPFENPPQQQLLEIYDSYLLYLITIPEIRYMTPRIGAYLLKEFFKMKRKEPVRTLLKEFLELEPSQQAFFFKLMWLDMEQDYSFCYRRGNINIRSDLRDSVVLIIGDGFLLHNETCYHGEQAGIIFQSIPMQLLHSCRLKTYIVSIEEFDDRVALIRSDKVER